MAKYLLAWVDLKTKKLKVKPIEGIIDDDEARKEVLPFVKSGEELGMMILRGPRRVKLYKEVSLF